MSPTTSVQRVCLSVVVLAAVKIFGVASYNLTISPEHVHISWQSTPVTINCSADVPLAGCQIKWWDHNGITGPLLDLSGGHQSKTNPAHLTEHITWYSYNGRGLHAGDCGVTLQVKYNKHWLVGCRVRALQGGWKYSWMDLTGEVEDPLDVTVTPREIVVDPGMDAHLVMRSREPLGVCWLSLPGMSGGPSLHRGVGLPTGECAITVHNITEQNCGPAWCAVRTLRASGGRHVPVIVTRPPNPPVLDLVYQENTLSASCSVTDGRPIPTITWYLGNEIIRQDDEDDAPADLKAPWRWPWDKVSITQILTRHLKPEDNGKDLTCVLSHPALPQPLEAPKEEVVFINYTGCKPLPRTNGSNWSPQSCSQEHSEEGARCHMACSPGYVLSGGSEMRCTDVGWTGKNGINHFSKCNAISELAEEFTDKINKTLSDKEANLLFLLDESGSVAKREFAMEIQFMKALVTAFPLAEHRSAGVITFSSDSEADIVLNTADSCDFIDQADLIEYSSGGTNILGALQRAISEIEANSVHNFTLVFLITDGLSETNPAEAANHLKNNGSVIFTLGIANYDPKQLIPVASLDEDGQPIFFCIDSFEIFGKVAHYLETTYNPNGVDCLPPLLSNIGSS